MNNKTASYCGMKSNKSKNGKKDELTHGYGYCENCGKFKYLSDDLCYDCWIAEKAARNRVFLSKRGVNFAKK